MSSIIRVSESSPNSEWLVMSNQGTACFFELLLYAADDLEKTEHQKELISFLENQKSINDIASGTAGFDIVDMPWDENCLIEDIVFFFKLLKRHKRKLLLPDCRMRLIKGSYYHGWNSLAQ